MMKYTPHMSRTSAMSRTTGQGMMKAVALSAFERAG
jgi:hypothetical protein